MSKCRCSYCVGGQQARYDLVTVEDFDDEPRYRKTKKRNRKVCAKSKDNAPCDFVVPVIQWAWYSKFDERWHYTRVMTCKRCGRHGQYVFGTAVSKPLQ